MNYKFYIDEVFSSDIDKAEDIMAELKLRNKKIFNKCMDHLKVHFILTKDIVLLNKLALIFSTFKVHSSVPLIISKLKEGIYNESGGTLLYSLQGLKISSFEEEINDLRSSNISYEMKEMIEMVMSQREGNLVEDNFYK